ncbi:MAG: hypothetical protein OEO77_07640 [Acidimicrobiia bacterium]|nr:hypothetical protein [Acidimicrobiia bacterium]
MQRRLLLFFMVVLLLIACGDTTGEQTTITVPPVALTPAQTLDAFLGALQSGAYDETAPHVDEAQVALFASIEDASASTFLMLTDSGLTSQVRTNFWSSFAGAIDGLEGSTSADVIIDEQGQFVTAGERFARVDLRFRGEVASGVWVLRNVDDIWLVDPIATFGGAFVSPVRLWMRSIDPVDYPPVLSRVAGFRPSWEALAALQDENDEAGVAVLAELEGLLAELGGS